MIYMKFVGGPVYTVEFSEGLTVGSALQTIKNENLLEFRGNYIIQDIITGRSCADDEIALDGRLYYVNVFSLRHQGLPA